MIERLWRKVLDLLEKLPSRQINLHDYGDTEMEIREWRISVLNIFLVIAIIASIPAFSTRIFSELTRQYLSFPSYVYILVELILIALITFQKLSYWVRIFGMLLTVYTVMIVNLVTTGFQGSGPLYTLLVSVFALILIGKRASIFVSVLSAIFLTGLTILNGPEQAGQGSPLTMWMALTTILMILALTLTLLISFYRLQERIIENDRSIKVELLHAQKLLEEQNASLEQKVEEHTKELQESNKILSVLYKITDAASGAHDLHEFFSRIHQIIAELMYAKNFFIALYDDSTGLLSFPYFVDEKDEPVPTTPLENSHGVTSYIIRTGNSIRHGWDQYNELASNREVALEGTFYEDGIGAPLKIDQKIIGALFIQSYNQEIHYTEQDDKILDSVSRYVATALIRFRALEAERQRTTELAIINSVQSGLTAELGFQAIVNMVGDKLREALATHNITISLYDEKNNSLHYLYIFEKGERRSMPPQPPHAGSVFEKLIKTHEMHYLKYGGMKDESASAFPGTNACKSGIAIPVIHNNRILGAIQLEDFDHEHAYGESEIRLLTTIAASLGAAVENVHLSLQRNEVVEALRQSEERYRLITDNIEDVIWTTDTNYRSTYVSPSVRKLRGLEPEEDYQQTLDQVYTPSSLDIVLKEYHQAAIEIEKGNDVSTRLEVEQYRKDGSTVWVEISRRPLRDNTGRLTGFVGVSRDISVRKRVEEELQKKNAQLALTMHIAQIASWEIDPARNVFLFNDQFYALHNTTAEREGGYSMPVDTYFHEFVHPDDAEIFKKKYALSFTSGIDLVYHEADIRIICRGGEIHTQMVRLSIERDSEGKIIKITGNNQDITERKRAETELRASAEKLRLIFENAFDGISIYEDFPGEDKRILVECNERYCQMAGRSKKELLAIHDTRTVQCDLGTAAERFNWEPIAAGRVFSGVFSWIRPDGKENIIEYNAAPTQVGGRYLTVGLDRDVTERRQNELALRESEQRLMDIIDFLPLATLVIDKNSRITAWNRALEEMTAAKSKDMVGQGNYEYALPFYGKRTPILIDFVFTPEEELDARYRHIRRQGGILMAESFCEKLGDNGRMLIGFASALYGSDGQIRGAIESIEDVTDLRQAEKELNEAKEAAEAANRSKSVFLANMSHEIRTPMNAILGFTQLMLRNPDLSTQQREHLDVINRSGEHLLALINDILELSKIEAGRSTFIPTSFDLHRLLTDLEVMFRVRTEEKKLRMMMEMARDVPRWVITDEGKLRQVLINLIGNAVKFTEEGGVGVRIGIQPGQADKNLILFEVEDTGPGISAEEIGQLFKPFEQASSGVKMGGTGLGLSLSQGFVKIMGGTITVSSLVGKGSIFRFSIPFEEGKGDDSEHKGAHKKVLGLKPGQGEFRVLIADDRETNRQILSEILSSVGFNIREVTNGVEALEAFHTWKPRIILMDMRMPVMDGYEATRKVKEDREGQNTIVIAVTASAFQEDRQQIMAAGADAYISKPFKETDLFNTIHQLTGAMYLFENEVTEEQAGFSEKALLWKEAVAALPTDLVRECRELAKNADIFQLLERIADLSTLNAEIGQRLNEHAKKFAYEEIVNLLTNGE